MVILLGAALFGTLASVMPCSYGTFGYYGIVGGGALFGIGFLLLMIGFIFRSLRATGRRFMILGIAFMAEAFGFGFLAVKNCISG
jgi:hypothetical protein